jgi:hypothetical protein
MGYCPLDKPYYNTTLHECTVCPNNTFYNEETYQCEGGIVPVQPNICPTNTPYYNSGSKACE